jgi:hypothetical protein
MKKLILRLLALVLSVYLAGSVYPLFATEGGHWHGPAPSGPSPPPPPPTPPPTPSAPPMLDSRISQLPPPPPRDSGGGGCGPGTQPLAEALEEPQNWRKENFTTMANTRIGPIKYTAMTTIEGIKVDIRRAQRSWHQADLEVNKYQTKKNQGTLVNPELLEMALAQRQRSFQELQQQKDRITKVEAWRTRKIREIESLRDRAQNGDFHGYRALRDYDMTDPHPNQFK